MKVIYTVDFAIEVDAAAKNMAIHRAGERWPELREAVKALGSGVTIKRIRVEGAGKDEGGEE